MIVAAWAVVFSVGGYYFVDPVLEWLAKPVGRFIYTAPTDAFLIRLKLALGMGGVAAFPVFLYQAWRFVESALYAQERRLVFSILPTSTLLFFIGMALALFVVVPTAVRFLLGFGAPALLPMISIQAYLSFLFWMIIGFGVLFQLPLVIVVLCRTGVTTSRTLAAYRRHVFVGLLVLAALVTPGPDIFSQLVLLIPSYLLFEIALVVARRLE